MQPMVLAIAVLVAGPDAAAPASIPPVLVVRATTSASGTAERKYAQAVAGNISRRLRETGIRHDIVDDDAVSDATVRGHSVVVLPYNPAPPPIEVATLARHASAGGKLLVFFSGSERLAQVMGVKLVSSAPSQVKDRWCAIRFDTSAPSNVPPVVRQYSRSVRLAEPAAGGTRVIAGWEDVHGRPTGDAAWLRTPVGYWMTHIVLDDGDNDAKNRMILAMLGDMAPSVWPEAARHRLAEAVSIGSYRDMASALAAARNAAQDDAARARVDDRIAAANLLYARLNTFLTRGEYAAASDGCPDLRRAVLSAYAAARQPAADRLRGVWDRHGLGLYPGDWDRTCATLAACGINAIFVNVMTAGSAHYPSKVLHPSDAFTTFGDQLKAASESARRHGLEFHAWVICWSLHGATRETVQRLANQNRMQTSEKAVVPDWLCPTNPENVAHEKDAIRELVRLAPLTGVHLDYIRFHDSRSCTCSGCRARFEASTGRKVKNWPSDLFTAPVQEEFRSWRMDNISRLVQDVSVIVRTAQSNAVVSAAVYGHYPSATASVGQDWRKWVEKGCLDFICPMNYTDDSTRFEDYLREQVRLVGATRVFPGIGVTAAESRLDAAQVIDQIVSSRRLGARGFILFDLNKVVLDDVLPYLPFTPPARPLSY